MDELLWIFERWRKHSLTITQDFTTNKVVLAKSLPFSRWTAEGSFVSQALCCTWILFTWCRYIFRPDFFVLHLRSFFSLRIQVQLFLFCNLIIIIIFIDQDLDDWESSPACAPLFYFPHFETYFIQKAAVINFEGWTENKWKSSNS